MDETNTSDTSRTKPCIINNSTTGSSNNSCTSNRSSISIISNRGVNNMETKGTNIPTNAQHADSNDSISSDTVGATTTFTSTKETTSDQSNNKTTTKTQDSENSSSINGSSSSSTAANAIPLGILPAAGGASGNSERDICQGEKGDSSSGTPDRVDETDFDVGRKSSNSNVNVDHRHPPQAGNVSNGIDPLKEATTKTLPFECQQESRSQANCATVSSVSSAAACDPTTATVAKGKVLGTTDCDVESGGKSDSNEAPGQAPGVVSEGSSDLDANNKGAILNSVYNNSSNGSKPPVPNFRVEGSGTGDSSITVAVASLSSAVSASVTLHSSGGRGGGSTGGTNSLENGDQPGSSSGPVSIQSSEEMRLSLVSWYSEPDDPSRIIEGCCSALNTYRQEESEATAEEIITHTDICDSGSSMGHEAMTSAANNSPACKSESEEKENKTPEPCGNHDKMSDMVDVKNGTNDTISKSEFINPNHTALEKISNIDDSGNIINLCAPNQEERDCQSLSKSADRGGTSTLKPHANIDKSFTESIKSRKNSGTPPQKVKAHVQVSDHKQSCPGSGSHHNTSRGDAYRCHQDASSKHSKPECPRCSRRSKSGTTTPATGTQVAKSRTPASRRVVQSSKSSTEIKKPIKSILKHDSRGSAGSGSGSDKQSSMDSLGSSGEIGVTPVHILRGRMGNTLMTRSDSGTRARFNFNSTMGPSDTPTGVPEDKVVSKLKRIEKYATLRVRKSLKPRPLDLSDSEAQPSDVNNAINSSSNGGKVGVPGVPTEVMSKSMSYLEKSSSNRVHISSSQGHQFGESTSASSTLKRQGSLRVKKHTTPQWEPSGTRTSALRLQKMQEAKAKNSPSAGASSGSANSGSAHSGSGDSLHYLSHSANSTSTSAGSSGMSSIHLTGSHSAPAAHGRMSASAAAKEKHMGAKIFSKLSSALGQTASSNQKRVKQERGVQTDVLASAAATALDVSASGRVSLSPVPALELGPENVEQIKNLERLCNRYRNQFIKVQSEFERSECRKVELLKQLEETQHESTEMIEFLQAEKSTLAESLTEVEIEAQKWKDEMEALKRDYQSRCSSLVRLSEQHKQEALKSQALLQRLECQSTSVISQLSHQLTDEAQSIHQTTQKVTALTESLLKTYKVPPELLASSETNQPIKETDLSCSLLLPLITSLSAAFPMVPVEMAVKSSSLATTGAGTSTSTVTTGKPPAPLSTDTEIHTVTVKMTQPSLNKTNSSLTMTESSSLQSLNQAILEREAAEKSGLDDITKPFSLFEGASPDADQLSLRKEISELNAAIAKLLNVVRVIVIHCDRKVSSVASSILQCLKSIEDDKVGNMAEIAQVQKSLEAWSDKGISAGSSTTTAANNSGSPPCKTTATSTSVCESPSSYHVGNGHAHV